MGKRRTEREIVASALQHAIDDRLSYASCWDRDAPERAYALALVAAYRSVLKRRYGFDELPHERRLKAAEIVSIDQIAITPEDGEG